MDSPTADATLPLAEWEQVRFDALQSLPRDERHAAIEKLATARNMDPVWHVLAAQAQASPEDLSAIESAIASWSDGSRVMPHAWFESLQSGRFATYHQLVRQLVLKGTEAAVLHVPGVETSLGGLRGLGLRGLDRVAVEQALALDWLHGVQELHLTDSATPTAPDLPSVESLEIHGGEHAATELAALITGSAFRSRICIYPASGSAWGNSVARSPKRRSSANRSRFG